MDFFLGSNKQTASLLIPYQFKKSYQVINIGWKRWIWNVASHSLNNFELSFINNHSAIGQHILCNSMDSHTFKNVEIHSVMVGSCWYSSAKIWSYKRGIAFSDGSGSIFCCSGRVSHLWFGSEFRKFSIKIPNFSIFFLSDLKKSLWIGSKSTRVGFLFT